MTKKSAQKIVKNHQIHKLQEVNKVHEMIQKLYDHAI